jgi:hypothetical protein
LYLGSQSDIILIRQNYALWKNLYDEDTRLILSGENDAYIKNVLIDGKTKLKLDTLNTSLKTVDDFALAKSESLYQDSIKTKNNLNVNCNIKSSTF